MASATAAVASFLGLLLSHPAATEDAGLVRATIGTLDRSELALLQPVVRPFPPPPPSSSASSSATTSDQPTEPADDALGLLADWRTRPVAVLAVVHARLDLALDQLVAPAPTSSSAVDGGGGSSSDPPSPTLQQQQQQAQAAAIAAFLSVRHLIALGLPALLSSHEASTLNGLARSFAELARALGWEKRALAPLADLMDSWGSTAPSSSALSPAFSSTTTTTTTGRLRRPIHQLTAIEPVLLEACLRSGELAFARERVLAKGPIEGVHAAVRPALQGTPLVLLRSVGL